MKLNDKQLKMLQEEIVGDLSELLIKDFCLSSSEALDMLYNSDTYKQLCDVDTGLCYQSPGYIYSFLKTEMLNGSMTNWIRHSPVTYV